MAEDDAEPERPDDREPRPDRAGAADEPDALVHDGPPDDGAVINRNDGAADASDEERAGKRDVADDTKQPREDDDRDRTQSRSDEASEQARRGGRDKPRRDGPPTESQIADVVMNFFGDVDAQGGTLGSYTGSRKEVVRRRVTGRLAEAEVAAVTGRYAKPDCFADAVEQLHRHRVVVLEGPPGTGRRDGAVNLLREVTKGRLVVLSPLLTVPDLAEREYQKDIGYLVVDRMPDHHTADIDFTWANVGDQVRDGEAYLVVTSAAVAVRAANRAVRHVIWERAPVDAVLRRQLVGRGYLEDDVDDVVAQLVAALPDDCPLARLVDLAEFVAAGTDPDEALTRLDENAGREVQSWFAENRSLREILEVTALGFLEGADLRTFETLLARLHKATAKRMPAKQAKAALEADDPLGDRDSRVDGHDLIGAKDVQSGVGTSRIMIFKDEAYRRFVLEQLWRSRSTAFWDAVGEWLDQVVTGGDSMRVASGLAWLACASFDEVERSYLEPWSWGRMGWAGQVTSVYVLWYISHLDALAPVALQTAVRWAGGRDIDRRWTALVAFAGDLGVCYPTDAANRLWQLTSQSNDLSGLGCTALACLFATLTDETSEAANVVLTLLDLKMDKFGVGSGRESMPAKDLMRMRRLTMTASLATVSIASTRTRRSAIFEYLHQHPDRLNVASRIWAGVICYRPLRREALLALRRGLHALRDISGDPRDEARAFGVALSDAMPAHERPPFTTELMALDEQLRRGKKESPADVLLACLEAISTRTELGGTT